MLAAALAAVLASAAPPHAQALAHVCTWHAKEPGVDSWHEAATIPWRSAGVGIGYDADDPAIIAAQAAEMRQHGLVPLLSWWGPDAPRGGDGYFDIWTANVRDVPAAILYEGQGRLRQDRDGWWTVDAADNAARLRGDLTHLWERYWSRAPDRWFIHRGRVVVYLWPAHAMRGDLAAVLRGLPFRDRILVVGTSFDGLRLPDDTMLPMLSGMDAVTGYGFYSRPLMTEHGGVLSDALIARYRHAALTWQEFLKARLPGVELFLPLEFAYDDRNVPGRDNPVYEAAPEQAAKLMAEVRQIIGHFHATCGNVPALVTMKSYNEHFEGTALEPNDRFGDRWLRFVADELTFRQLPQSSCGR